MKTCYILMGLRQTLSRKKCVNRYVKTEKIIWCRRADLHVPVAGSSCISNDFSEDIESLKLVQSSNGEAIRTLSENIAYLTYVMSQIQDNITGNACESDELSKRKS